MMNKTLKLHSFADVDRSGKVRWTAFELGYDIEEIRIGLGEHFSPEYLQLNPYGQVPTVELDGKILVESAAICQLLAGRHPEANLAPLDSAEYLQYSHLMNSTLEPPLVNYYLSQRGFLDEAWQGLTRKSLAHKLDAFVNVLPEEGYLCGSFTLADIYAGYVLRLAVQSELLPLEGPLEAYMGRLRARPAAQASRIFDSL